MTALTYEKLGLFVIPKELFASALWKESVVLFRSRGQRVVPSYANAEEVCEVLHQLGPGHAGGLELRWYHFR
jgi:hypothetical protein